MQDKIIIGILRLWLALTSGMSLCLTKRKLIRFRYVPKKRLFLMIVLTTYVPVTREPWIITCITIWPSLWYFATCATNTLAVRHTLNLEVRDSRRKLWLPICYGECDFYDEKLNFSSASEPKNSEDNPLPKLNFWQNRLLLYMLVFVA